MKIIKMLLLVLALSSCGELLPSDGRFIVKNVTPYGKGVYEYQMVSVTGKSSFWVKDSSNKYIVGDTVTIVKLTNQTPTP